MAYVITEPSARGSRCFRSLALPAILEQASHAAAAEQFFAGHALGLAVFRRVRSVVQGYRDIQVRASKSQVAFRRKRGFAYLWLPGRYLRKPAAEVVLSIALGRHDDSARFKDVVHPAANYWMHHLEVRDVRDIDDEVVRWIREAADRAG